MNNSDSKRIRVFVSHKNEDREIAGQIKTLLEKYAPNRLEFFISGENIIAGDDWKERIRDELRISNLLFLLFTEPTKDWDWCLFEAGLFTPLLGDNEQRRIICLYPSDSDGPRPLTNLQGVKADHSSMCKFISEFFCSSNITCADPPLNDLLSPVDISEMAEQICALIGPQNIESYYPSFRIKISIPQSIKIKSNTFPKESTVTGNASSLAIFGLGEGKHSWADLICKVGKHGTSDWVEEVGKAFHLAAKRHVLEPTTATFRAADGGKIYRPVLYRLDFGNEHPVAASIVLTEEITPHDVGGPMFRLLRMSTRFGEEVITPHMGKMKDLAKRTNKATILKSLMESVEAIEYESANKGLDDEKTIKAYFAGDRMSKDKVGEIFGRWREIRENLEIAVSDEDLNLAEKLLREMDSLQREFIIIAAERYHNLIKEDNDEFFKKNKQKSPHLIVSK